MPQGAAADEIQFDLSKALINLKEHGISIPEQYTKTPAASPVKANRRRINAMNGDVDDSMSSSSSPPSLLELLSPSSGSSSSSSSSFHHIMDDDTDSPCHSEPSSPSIKPCFLSVIQTTILEEAVEMSLPGDDGKENNNNSSLNSSILSMFDCEQENQTPAKVEYCGIIWPCCHSTSSVLVDENLHAKICNSLGMEQWSCWQTTYQASPSPLGVRRSYHRGQKKLDSLRRTLIPMAPKKTQSFSPLLNVNNSFASYDSGYESDPQAHLVHRIVAGPSTLRATTVDEFFNERLRLILHTRDHSKGISFWLERGMAGLAIPPQLCWFDGTNRTSIPLLEITKILNGPADRSIPASALRCFRICIAGGTHYTMEAPNKQMQVDLTTLLKTTIASLAAAVLTHGDVDEFFVRKEAWI